jgi:hypothetical protein
MNRQNNVEEMYQRILSIPLDGDAFKDEHLYLMLEYMRRVALWQQALKCAEARPFFDIADQIDPSIRVDSEMVNVLHGRFKQGVWVGRIGEWALHFAALQDAAKVQHFDLPVPYEPLIVLFEEGGTFTITHEGVLLNGTTMRLSGWTERASSIAVVKLDK